MNQKWNKIWVLIFGVFTVFNISWIVSILLEYPELDTLQLMIATGITLFVGWRFVSNLKEY